MGSLDVNKRGSFELGACLMALMHTRASSAAVSAVRLARWARDSTRWRVLALSYLQTRSTSLIDSFGLVATSSSAAKVRRSDTIDIGMAESTTANRPGIVED